MLYMAMLYIAIYGNAILSVLSILSFPCCVHKSTLYVCFSIPALQIDLLVPFFF